MKNYKPENGNQSDDPSSADETKKKINLLYELINKARKQSPENSDDKKDDDEEDTDGLQEYRGTM